MRPTPVFLAASVLAAMVLSGGRVDAQADREFRYENPAPAYDLGQGPAACFDAAHENFHTLDGEYWPFAELLRGDGFSTRQIAVPLAGDADNGCDVLIIATPVHPTNRDDWSLPHPSAFTKEEIGAIFAWVNGGGGLLLVADHAPIPGALADLAAVFGVAFIDGEARNSPNRPLPDVHSRGAGEVHDHVITSGRGPVDEVSEVATWTGAPFRTSREFHSLLTYGPESRAWAELVENFPHLPPASYPVFEVEGWLAAAARDVGEGRLVVFGEASMCTAQRNDRGPWGMNTEAGSHNARFCLNVARWLSGAPVNPAR